MGTTTPTMECINKSMVPITDNEGVKSIGTLMHPVIFFVFSWGKSKWKDCSINKSDCSIEKAVI
jgi:hypothetical protein